MACGCNGIDGSNSKAESVIAAPSKPMYLDRGTIRKAAIGFAIGVGAFFVYKAFIK